MAHFVKLENGVVVQGIVVNNAELLDENGVESEDKGTTFCANLLGGTWKQTSYNARIRKNYAGIGYTYDEGRDAFIPPKPFNSWVLNETTCLWDAPIPMPIDDNKYSWNEETQSWTLQTI